MTWNLGDAGAVLAVDETGFLKKGRAEREQGADRPGAVPAEEVAEDRDRCRAAGTGGDVAFATKPHLARRMIERAVHAGVPFSWVAGDEVYGGHPGLREWLDKEEISYVLAVACDEMIAARAARGAQTR